MRQLAGTIFTVAGQSQKSKIAVCIILTRTSRKELAAYQALSFLSSLLLFRF
ncbi:MAG: hypothetical protein LDLANPLL_00685 [Turneriella sp.]|nr:hypothetical protein [Turneriella sp.]